MSDPNVRQQIINECIGNSRMVDEILSVMGPLPFIENEPIRQKLAFGYFRHAVISLLNASQLGGLFDRERFSFSIPFSLIIQTVFLPVIYNLGKITLVDRDVLQEWNKRRDVPEENAEEDKELNLDEKLTLVFNSGIRVYLEIMFKILKLYRWEGNISTDNKSFSEFDILSNGTVRTLSIRSFMIEMSPDVLTKQENEAEENPNKNIQPT